MAVMTNIEKLEDAAHQLHLLLSGQQAKVFVDSNGERVEYTAANRTELQKYVDKLQGLVDAAAGKTKNLGPMRVYF